MKVLAIDDNPDNLTTLKAVVQDALPDCTLLTALNGSRGLVLASAEDPDVILLDVVMPDMDGFEVCRRLKADAQLCSIPVVFVTALRTDRESRVRALEAGAEGFLSKPIDEQELTAQIRAMARIKAASRMQRMEKEELAALVAERTHELEQELSQRRQAEAKLAKAAQEWQSTFDATSDAIWVLDNDHRVLRSNKATAEMFHHPLCETLGKTCWAVAHAMQEPHPNCPFVRARQSGHREKMEFQDGDRWIGVNVDPIRNETGEITGAVHIVTDITERKQAENIQAFLAQTSSGALGEPFFQALARFLAASLRMHFVCIDRLEGDGLTARTVAVWCDGKFEDNVTYALQDTPCGDVVGKQICVFPAKVCELFPRDPVLRDLQAESYAGVTLFDHAGRPIGLIAVIGRAPLLHRSQAETTLKMVAVRAAGELERLQAEEVLRETQSILQAAMDNSPAGIAIAEAPDGKLRYVNDAGLLIRGGERETIVKDVGIDQYVASWQLLDLDGRLLKSEEVPLARAIKLGETCSREFIVRRSATNDRIVSANAAPIRNAQDKVVAGIVVFTDITERRQLEAQYRQSQKMEAIGLLAGGVAHDFNNILSSLLLQTDLLQSVQAMPQEVAEGIRQIRTDAQRATRLVRQLLLFGRRQVMQPSGLDLNEVVTHFGQMLQRIIGEDIQLQLRLHSTPLHLHADPGMIEQVILNFATNARDAMPNGGQLVIATSLRTMTKAEAQQLNAEAGPGQYVCLSVSDTGTGIPPEALPKIFEPFFTTKDVGKGTGLGLASVFGIIKQHKGAIEVDNRPGQGVTFRVYFLALTAPVAEPAVVATDPPVIRVGAETILLVEDEETLRRLTRRILERQGYQVLVAANGVAALELWRQHRDRVAVLLTDMVMPAGISGSELAKRLRAEQPILKVVYVSGYSLDAIKGSLDLGAGRLFVQKPYTPGQLLEAIHRCLVG